MDFVTVCWRDTVALAWRKACLVVLSFCAFGGGQEVSSRAAVATVVVAS